MVSTAVEPAGFPFFDVVGTVGASPRPDPGVVDGGPPDRVFEPEQAVLGAQGDALRALCGRRIEGTHGRAGAAMASDDRARLVALAVRVVIEAATKAEAECRRIVGSAEAQAATIVQDARDDVEWLARRLRPGVEEPWAEATDGAQVPALEPPPLEFPPPAREHDAAHRDDDIGQEFFASFAFRDEDPWSFMDDEPVGVAPALLRRVLRRAVSPRRQTVGRVS